VLVAFRDSNAQAIAQIAQLARAIDVVEFDYGRATMRSSIDAFKTDWIAANPGNYVLAEIVASNIQTDTESLDDSRLDALDKAIGTTSDLSVERRLELPGVPA